MRNLRNLSIRFLFASLFCLTFAAAAQAATFTVNSVGDDSDFNIGDGICQTRPQVLECTLRAAIQESGAAMGVGHTIEFAIPGAGVKTISPLRSYGALVRALTIDGRSQGGNGYNGPPLIEINGNLAGAASGFIIDGNGTDITIRGLIINRFDHYGISILGGQRVTVKGCYIGTDSTGTIRRRNAWGGISATGSGHVFGGNSAPERNIISGNGGSGIETERDTQILGNYIGTDVTGAVEIGNDGPGIKIKGESNTIGGNGPGEGNLISGNEEGIYIQPSFSVDGPVAANNNIITGNLIGTAADGSTEIGNSGDGIFIWDGQTGTAESNRIGGIASGAGNVIAFSGGAGILIRGNASKRNKILRNSIYSNGSLGIDLAQVNGTRGVTENDPADSDTGANDFQNFPVLTSAVTDNGATTINGTLTVFPRVPIDTYSIELFSNPSCDATGNGEGKVLLGSTTASDPTIANFSFTTPSAVQFGRFITATATSDTTGDSSEFSQCIQVVRANSFIVTNTNDSGPGSLRKAIGDANLILGLDTITFDIPASGVQTINLLSALPEITDPVIIDGSSQPGFSGVPLIELNGVAAGTGTTGLRISSGESTIRSLTVNRFQASGIELLSGNSTVVGCYIGTDSTGTVDLGNGGNGIRLDNSTANRIGGSSVSDRNVISGNNADGILVFGKGSADNEIVGNFIGTDVTGTADLGNTGDGIDIDEGLLTIIGGSTPDVGNLISGNDGNGIRISSSFRNYAGYNKIGTDVTGLLDLGNTLDGVQLGFNANNNRIGGPTGGNTIAFNADGVNVFQNGSGNEIRGNSIFGNNNLGIDLAPNGKTPNDVGDADTGANDLQNFPEITSAQNLFNSGRIDGTLNSTPQTEFTLDFYANGACDPSGNGEGRVYLGSKRVTSNNNGDTAFNFISTVELPIGTPVTATATTQLAPKNTSEFSPCVTVTEGPGTITFSAATDMVNEGDGTRIVVVKRLGGAAGDITVDYSTSDGTASTPSDYALTAGTLTFLNGETRKTFDVPIVDDPTDENDETINLTLSNPTSGVSLTPNPTSVLTIIDNDAPPTLSVADAALLEGNIGSAQIVLAVQLSNASTFPVTVDFATANGTATANQDYLPSNGQLSFAPGETSKTVAVTVLGDLTVELDETFSVNLSNPVNATILDGQGIATITDDDNPGRFSFSLAPYSGVENTTVTITVTRSNGTAGTVAVDYATNGGSAVPFTDYNPVSGNLVFADGETSKTFPVELLEDSQIEPTESFNVVLSNPVGGATLGVPSVAPVNILDNDSGTLLSISGTVKLADNSPVANVSVALQGDASGSVLTDNLGQFSFTNLAPNGTYSVTPAAIGYTFSPISREYANLSADVTSANFTATAAPSRQLRIIGGSSAPGQDISVNVELVAQGDENSVGFTLNFDPAILANPVATAGADASGAILTLNALQYGKLGVLLALPAGTSFPAGTRQILTVTFNALPTAAYNSPITFGDLPIARQVVNTNADPLPTTYIDGAVTFAQGYESDVAPRPTGSNNGSVSIADFTQVGRFVAGLDTLNPNFNEFQRADSAPRVSRGDGVLTVSDYTQAGRYAAGIDPVVPSGGQPFASLTGGLLTTERTAKAFAVPTGVRIVSATGGINSQVVVAVETDAQGGENGFGFSVNYDPTKLANPFVTVGNGVPGSTLIPNTLQPGRVGVVLGLPFGVGLTAGTKQLVEIRFDVRAGAATGESPLVLSDSPVAREVSDVDANVLPSTFQDGMVNIIIPTAASVQVGGRVMTNGGRGLANAGVLLTDASGTTRTARTSSFGYYRFDEVAVGQTVFVRIVSKETIFAPRFVSVTDAINDLDFVEEP